MARYVFLSLSSQNLSHPVDDVMRHERLSVVFADVAIGCDAGLGPQIPGELATLVIFHNDGLFALGEDGSDCLSMERHNPLDL